MIKEGKESKAKYWGSYIVQKIVKLDKPVVCYSDKVGKAYFKPTIVKIEWKKKPPSNDKHDIWFPYWIVIKKRENYGQYAPMIGQKALLELLKKAIFAGFFNNNFLKNLKKTIEKKLAQPFFKSQISAKKHSGELNIKHIYDNIGFNIIRTKLNKNPSLIPKKMQSLIRYSKGKKHIAWLYYPPSPSAKVFQILLRREEKYPRNLIKNLSNWGWDSYQHRYRTVYIRNRKDAAIVVNLIEYALRDN